MMSDRNFSLPRGPQPHNNGDSNNESGSLENHRPYVPKYSAKDESLLRRVDLNNMESVNAVFFPTDFANGELLVVPKHILGLDTDFAFVSKKVEEFKNLPKAEQQRECTRWDKMQRWERNMHEDRIAILMQQRALLGAMSQMGSGGGGATMMNNNNKVNNATMVGNAAAGNAPSPSNVPNNGTNAAMMSGGGVLMNRVTSLKRNREFQMASMVPTATPAVAVSASELAVGNVASPTTSAVSMPPASLYYDIPESKRRCRRMKSPIPSRYQGDIEAEKDCVCPEFVSLMNFPSLSLPDNLRCCVMCGTACPTSAAVKIKNKAMGRTSSKTNSHVAFIPTQNKGLCTMCDVHVWVINSTGMEIKWCKGCKNFRTWAAFGDKGHATKCIRCRDRQREKYAAQKGEKAAAASSSSSLSSKSK